MHTTKDDLPEKARAPLVKLLTASLAEAIGLQTPMKRTGKGPDIIALHELFDKIDEQVEECVDQPSSHTPNDVSACGTSRLSGLSMSRSNTRRSDSYEIVISTNIRTSQSDRGEHLLWPCHGTRAD